MVIKKKHIMSFLFFAIASDAANVSQDIGINVKVDNMKVPDWVHHFSLKTEQLNQVCRCIASIYYGIVGAESLTLICH